MKTVYILLGSAIAATAYALHFISERLAFRVLALSIAVSTKALRCALEQTDDEAERAELIRLIDDGEPLRLQTLALSRKEP